MILFSKCCTVDPAYPHGGEGSLTHGDRVKCVLYISVTLAYGKGEAALSIQGPSEVLEGMLKLLALAGASNGLETSLYIQKFMISTEGKGV